MYPFRLPSPVILALGLTFAAAASAAENCIDGTVIIAANLAEQIDSGGTLFVYAREVGRKEGPPTVVVRIDDPTYPQTFKLCPEDQMIPSAAAKPLTDRYQVYARHSASGRPMVKEGFLGTSHGEIGEGIRAGESSVVEIREPLLKELPE